MCSCFQTAEVVIIRHIAKNEHGFILIKAVIFLYFSAFMQVLILFLEEIMIEL